MNYPQKISVIILAMFVFNVGPAAAKTPDTEKITVVPINAGTELTIYEQTRHTIRQQNISVPDLEKSPQKFITTKGELYTISLSGPWVKIHCYYNSELGLDGGNIVAAHLKGIYGQPDGLWASLAVGYELGTGGVAESRFNALGDDRVVGPYLPGKQEDSYSTYLGSDHSEITLGFSIPKTHQSDISVLMAQINAKIKNLQKQAAAADGKDLNPKDYSFYETYGK